MTDDIPEHPDPLRDSLLVSQEAAAISQPLLFSDLREEAYESLEATGEFTGQRLAERNPEKYRLIVEMIAEGVLSERQIAKSTKVSPNTVAAVREREKVPIEALKERILRGIRKGLQLSVERVVELAPTMTARDAVIAVGVLSEKMQLLSGEATVIVANSGDKAKHADFNALLESLPIANAHEVPPMGSPEETGGQKGPGELALSDGSADSESAVCSGEKPESNGQRNNTPTDPPIAGGSDIEGGRGSAEGAGGQ